jgi:hypothetical protein
MKTHVLLAAAVLCCQTIHAQSLTEQERKELLEKLEKLRDSAEERVDARFRAAISAYSAAVASESAAREFYLKCTEKVNFTDQKRKSQDFREWKRREDERLSAPGFALALQIQLRWLILTLQAASENSDRAQLASAAQSVINTMVGQASALADHHQILGQGATSSVFARAYEIAEVQVEKWPLAPGDIGAVYDEILLPPLRARREPQQLRAAWTQRIQQEMVMQEKMPSGEDNHRKVGMSSAMRTAAYERFLSEGLPELQWEMELDLYKHGDERNAAMNMLAHIAKNITHKSARKWGEELEGLLAPKAGLEAAVEP